MAVRATGGTARVGPARGIVAGSRQVVGAQASLSGSRTDRGHRVSTDGSPEESRESPPGEKAPAPATESRRLIDLRYCVKRVIGQGGMGAVFQVEDLITRERKALKQIRTDRSDAKSVHILKNEFLSLAPLRHPNVARVFDFGHDWRTGEYYFTCEYVPGHQLLRATASLSLDRPDHLEFCLEIMVQILRGLEFVHSRGLVHGDLKPENILVTIDESEPGGTQVQPVVKVIDFGLTKREKDFGGKKIFGTTFYIAPETILGSLVDRRTDIYSLGVVFYQLLTRQLPFRGDSNLKILKGHLEEIPLPPHEVQPHVPEAVSEVILRMLEKKPGDRPSSAIEVIRALEEARGVPIPLETPQTLAAYLMPAECIGRRQIQSELRSYFHSIFKVRKLTGDDELSLSFSRIHEELEDPDEEIPPPPTGKLLLLRGEEGIGKSRLLDDLRLYAEVRGVPLIRLAIRPEEVSRNLNLRRFLDALSRTFSKDEQEHRRLQVQLFQTLVGPTRNAAENLGDHNLHALADQILKRCTKSPILLAFSRLDLAEELLLRFLRALVHRISDPSNSEARILILVPTRDEELETPSLRRLLLSPQIRSHFRELPLDRLASSQIDGLLEQMFGKKQFTPAFSRRLYEESDGNPGILTEILGFFMKQGKLGRTLEGWKFEGQIERESIPAKVRRELVERIEGLGEDARKLGIAFAVLGDSCELELASRLAVIPHGKILSTLLTLKKERLVREDGEGSEDTFSFTHQSAREILLNLLTPESLVSFHRRAGELLEERRQAGHKVDPRQLANHFLRAGDTEAGVRYGLLTAQMYAKRQMPQKTLELYREVRAVCQEGSTALVRDLDFQIAMLESTIGNTPVAARLLLRWLDDHVGELPEGEAKITRPDVLTELGIIECRLGDIRSAGRRFQDAYRHYQADGMTPGLLRLLLGFASLFYYLGNFMEALKYCERILPEADQLKTDSSRGTLYLLLSECHWQLGHVEQSRDHCRTSLQFLDRGREVGAVGFTLFNLGKYYCIRGNRDKALKQFQICMNVYRKISIRDLEADSLREMGILHLEMGSPVKAVEQLEEALDLYEHTGHLWARLQSLIHLGEAYRQLGRYEDAELSLGRAEQGNQTLSNPLKNWEILCTRGRIYLDQGQFDRARETFEQASSYAEQRALKSEDILVINMELQCQLALALSDFKKALDLTALGLIHAREIQNKPKIAPLIDLRLQIYLRLGRTREMERLINELHDIGTRNMMPILVARAEFFSALVAMAEGDSSRAESLFEKALETFSDRRSERNLADLYLEYGLAKLRLGDHERSYLLFEEGAFLSKKLNLVPLRCRFVTSMGLLEAQLSEGKISQAKQHFQTAEKLARKHNLQESLWKILFRVAQLLERNGQVEVASRAREEAKVHLKQVLDKIPEKYHASYRELFKTSAFQFAESDSGEITPEARPEPENTV